MPNLIVIRIVPPAPIDAAAFTGYLNPTGPGLGPLQITAFDLSFDSPTIGQSVGTAVHIAPKTLPQPTVPVSVPPGPIPTFASPQYAPDPTSGIIQQYDLSPSVSGETAFYQLESVATAVIEIPATATIENLRLVAQWGSSATAPQIPISQDFYDLNLIAAPTPSQNAWNPSLTQADPIPDPWGAITSPNMYLQLPQPPTTTGPTPLQLPTDGTPPRFSDLLPAVKSILQSDPGPAVTAMPTVAPTAGSLTLQLPAATSGIVAGMTVSGTGIPAGTTVLSIDSTALVTLDQEISGAVATVTFTPNLGGLTVDQCRNIAYEIVWSQQPPPPTPPVPLEEMYTFANNNGQMLLSGNKPNQSEADRQQFEATLKSYYTVANTAADRLTNFVYSLSAAIGCEQLTLAATAIQLEFPVNPGATSGLSANETSVILTGVGAPINFGVPASYFYALAAALPDQITAQQRYASATRDELTNLLTKADGCNQCRHHY